MPNLQISDKFANRYLLKKLIGIGGYSQVWLASDSKSANLDIAIKIFAPGQGLDNKGLELFSKEYALVFNLNHKNLLIPKHFDDFEGSPYLVMQYCQQGSVFGKIGEMTEVELARFMQQSASALNYLHQQEPPIIHQDIKPDNFLIDNTGNYLLADFGISSKIRRTLTKSIGSHASTGTLAYMPPEKFSADKQIIKAGDIFSLGVTMYELFTGNLPFGDHGGMVMLTGAQVPNLPATFSPELNTLLGSCMAKDPWERPPAGRLEEAATKFLQTGKWPIVSSATPNPVPAPPNEPVPPIGGRTTQPIPEPLPGPLPVPKPNHLYIWIILGITIISLAIWIFSTYNKPIPPNIAPVIDSIKVIADPVPSPEPIQNQKSAEISYLELYDCLNLFIPDQSLGYDLLDWKQEANNTQIHWITEGIELDANGFYREGEMVLAIDKNVLECLGEKSQPCKWHIVLFGPRGGYTSFKIESVYHQELEEKSIGELFKGKEIKFQLVNQDEFTNSYKVKFPNKKQVLLDISWSCGSAGCHINIECKTYIKQ